ncbi:MAG: hypothetical protein K8E66_08045 [Phycisphaerales bacterium]|nr:hypothetical protein [Phycisphaerales bacterium]
MLITRESVKLSVMAAACALGMTSSAGQDQLLLAVVEFDGLPAGVNLLDPATGAVLGEFVAPDFDNNGMLLPVEAISAGPARSVLFAQPGGDGKVSRYDENGVFIQTFIGGTPDPNPVDNIRGMTVIGDFLITSDWDDTNDIHRFILADGSPDGLGGDPLGTLVFGSQAAPGLGQPQAIEARGNVDLLVGDIARRRIVRYNPLTGTRLGDLSTVEMTASVTDIDWAPDGSHMVTAEDGSGDRVRLFSAAGTLLNEFGFNGPEGVHRLADGNYLVTSGSSFGQGKGLFRVSPNGTILATIDDSRSYGPIELVTLIGGGCNPADLAPPFGVLDLADLQAFVIAFIGMDPAADLAPPAGVFDLADLSAYVSEFLAGCP